MKKNTPNKIVKNIIIKNSDIILTQDTDKLGTLKYVNLLEGILADSIGTSKIIGLLGRWGIGKTSIINTLKERYKEKSEIKFIVYNTWKYQGDGFRRSFLMQLEDELEIKEKKLHSFYETQTKNNYNFSVFEILGLILVIILLVMISIGLVKHIITYISIENTKLEAAISLSMLLTTFIGILFSFFKNQIIINPINSPEQFEEYFKEIIKNYLAKNEKNKIIIVFDDLDRCHEDDVYNQLSTIKNFLEHKKIDYIIPISIDENQQSKIGNNKISLDFLRKVCNVTLDIKTYSSDDILEIVQGKVGQFKHKFQKDTLDLVAQEFMRNPRKLVHFLNSLSLEIESYKLQYKRITVNEELIIVKLLLIKYEFPNFYKKIIQNSDLLTTINNKLKNDEAIHEITNTDTDKDNKLLLFLKKTRSIENTHIERIILNTSDFDEITQKFKDNIKSEFDYNLIRKELEKTKIIKLYYKFFLDQFIKKCVEEKLRFSAIQLLGIFLKLLTEKNLNISFFNYLTKEYNNRETILCYIDSNGDILEYLFEMETNVIVELLQTKNSGIQKLISPIYNKMLDKLLSSTDISKFDEYFVIFYNFGHEYLLSNNKKISDYIGRIVQSKGRLLEKIQVKGDNQINILFEEIAKYLERNNNNIIDDHIFKIIANEKYQKVITGKIKKRIGTSVIEKFIKNHNYPFQTSFIDSIKYLSKKGYFINDDYIKILEKISKQLEKNMNSVLDIQIYDLLIIIKRRVTTKKESNLATELINIFKSFNIPQSGISTSITKK